MTHSHDRTAILIAIVVALPPGLVASPAAAQTSAFTEVAFTNHRARADQFVTDGEYLYWAQLDHTCCEDVLEESKSSIWRLPLKSAGAADKLVDDVHFVSGLSVDRTHVYFFSRDDAKLTLSRIPRGGGKVKQVWTGNRSSPAEQSAVNDSYVYWITDHSLRRVAKTGGRAKTLWPTGIALGLNLSPRGALALVRQGARTSLIDVDGGSGKARVAARVPVAEANMVTSAAQVVADASGFVVLLDQTVLTADRKGRLSKPLLTGGWNLFPLRSGRVLAISFSDANPSGKTIGRFTAAAVEIDGSATQSVSLPAECRVQTKADPLPAFLVHDDQLICIAQAKVHVQTL